MIISTDTRIHFFYETLPEMANLRAWLRLLQDTYPQKITTEKGKYFK